jgi:hypothetical protein
MAASLTASPYASPRPGGYGADLRPVRPGKPSARTPVTKLPSCSAEYSVPGPGSYSPSLTHKQRASEWVMGDRNARKSSVWADLSSPGPVYQMRSSVEEQTTSNKVSSPRFGFGTQPRLGGGHEATISPGPGAYSPRVTKKASPSAIQTVAAGQLTELTTPQGSIQITEGTCCADRTHGDVHEPTSPQALATASNQAAEGTPRPDMSSSIRHFLTTGDACCLLLLLTGGCSHADGAGHVRPLLLHRHLVAQVRPLARDGQELPHADRRDVHALDRIHHQQDARLHHACPRSTRHAGTRRRSLTRCARAQTLARRRARSRAFTRSRTLTRSLTLTRRRRLARGATRRATHAHSPRQPLMCRGRGLHGIAQQLSRQEPPRAAKSRRVSRGCVLVCLLRARLSGPNAYHPHIKSRFGGGQMGDTPNYSLADKCEDAPRFISNPHARIWQGKHSPAPNAYAPPPAPRRTAHTVRLTAPHLSRSVRCRHTSHRLAPIHAWNAPPPTLDSPCRGPA